jgi:hypothetical protein
MGYFGQYSCHHRDSFNFNPLRLIDILKDQLTGNERSIKLIEKELTTCLWLVQFISWCQIHLRKVYDGLYQ